MDQIPKCKSQKKKKKKNIFFVCKIGINLCDPELGNGFLGMTPKRK